MCLNGSTLVLNRNWSPINVKSVRQSLSDVYAEEADVVEVDYRQFTWKDWTEHRPVGRPLIQATGGIYVAAPEVIVLREFDKTHYRKVAFSRRNVYKRDGYQCQYCGDKPTIDELSIDHVVPKSQGGQSTWENCALACLRCNSRKANRTPRQAGMKLRKVPVRPDWRPVYALSSNRPQSWAAFLSKANWEVPLQP
jgi:5-methylcytosine-specific restriction endonuclease McrA